MKFIKNIRSKGLSKIIFMAFAAALIIMTLIFVFI